MNLFRDHDAEGVSEGRAAAGAARPKRTTGASFASPPLDAAVSDLEGPLARVLSVLEKVKREGGGFVAACPAHPDNRPSLRVDVASDRILFVCRAGCSQDDVLRALRLEWSDLFFEGRRTIQVRRGRRRPLETQRLLNQVTRPQGLIEFNVAMALVKLFDGDARELAVTYREEWDRWAAQFGMGGAACGPRPEESGNGSYTGVTPAAHTKYPSSWPAPHVPVAYEALMAHDLDPFAVLDFFCMIVDCLDPVPLVEVA